MREMYYYSACISVEIDLVADFHIELVGESDLDLHTPYRVYQCCTE